MKLYNNGDDNNVTFVPRIPYTGTVDGNNTDFTLPFGILENSEQVVADGVVLHHSEYTVTDSVITINVPPTTFLTISGYTSLS
jgi:hypothetical protein